MSTPNAAKLEFIGHPYRPNTKWHIVAQRGVTAIAPGWPQNSPTVKPYCSSEVLGVQIREWPGPGMPTDLCARCAKIAAGKGIQIPTGTTKP